VVSALCWCGGMLLSALGIYLHQFWLMILGSGVIGGIGLGLGYISPVSTLIKWFPDRRGMATGMAIMGFGGGAMIGSPLAVDLMKRFSTATDVGVMQTFVIMALGYFVFMMAGALRLPRAALGLEARRLDAAPGANQQHHDHAAPRAREEGLGHSPVLARSGWCCA
jgi:MFS family permease